MILTSRLTGSRTLTENFICTSASWIQFDLWFSNSRFLLRGQVSSGIHWLFEFRMYPCWQKQPGTHWSVHVWRTGLSINRFVYDTYWIRIGTCRWTSSSALLIHFIPTSASCISKLIFDLNSSTHAEGSCLQEYTGCSHYEYIRRYRNNRLHIEEYMAERR